MAEETQSNVLLPPSDNDAEMLVLGCILSDERIMNEIEARLRPIHFSKPENAKIYEVMCELYEKGAPIETFSVQSALQNLNILEQTGGIEYIISLEGAVSTTANVMYYVDIIIEKAKLRSILKASGSIKDMVFAPNDGNSSEKIIEKAEKLFSDISDDSLGAEYSSIDEVLVASISKIEEIYKNKNKVTGIETGFTDFDYMTAGLQPSDFILIAARPSMGKTAFALNIVEHTAVSDNKGVVVFSLEMSKEQLANRLLASQALVDSQRIRTGTLDDNDWIELTRALKKLSSAPIYIIDKSDISMSEMRVICRKLKKEKNIKMVVIDYLQLMSGDGRKNDSRQQVVSDISRALKGLARELDIPVVALSQLNRSVEQRPNKRPMLSDLRESGAIEQDADLVCFLYRDEYYNKENTEKPGIAEVIIAKQRNGSTGKVELRWLGEYTKFGNLEKDYV